MDQWTTEEKSTKDSNKDQQKTFNTGSHNDSNIIDKIVSLSELIFMKEETEVPGENPRVKLKSTKIQPCTMTLEVGGTIQ